MNSPDPAGHWLPAPAPVHLPAGELHLWRADAGSFPQHETMLTALLSKDELDKANTFRRMPDRNRSILARAVLRDILGRYLKCDPRSLGFVVAGQGKPELDPALHAGAPHFSLSHSGAVVLFAFTLEHDVGVDVEAIRSNLDMLEIAQRFFAPDEVEALLGLPEIARRKAFFCGWTRKEAYLKARAEGIASGLERFSVTLAPGMPVRLLNDERYPGEASKWYLHDIALGHDYAAAAAVRCGGLSMRHWIW